MTRERRLSGLVRVPPIGWAGILAGSVAALGGLTTVGAVQRLDASAVRTLNDQVLSRGLQEQVFAVTDLAGSPMLLVALTAVVTLLLVGRWRAALVMALAVTLTKLGVALLKALVERDRPGTGTESYDTFSFPSGHAASAAALYMTFAFLLTHDHRPSLRRVALAAGAAITILVGLSRVALGAHFPTDVVAGWLVGGLLGILSWVLVVRVAGRPLTPQQSHAERASEIALSTRPQVDRIPEDARI